MVRIGNEKMSAPKRFFIEEVAPEMTLEGEEFNHAKNVLRLVAGDEITLLDNSGKEYSAIITAVGKKNMSLHVVGETVGDKESKTPVRLLCAELKGDKTELVVQKAVELGVKEICIFHSRYCSAYMNENKLERLNKVAREAAKQCLRSVAPKVEFIPNFAFALETGKDFENKLFACEFAKKSDADVKNLCGSTVLVIGSEGGFSEDEFALAQSMGYAGITLGKRILRAETAAIAFTAVVTFALGDLG